MFANSVEIAFNFLLKLLTKFACDHHSGSSIQFKIEHEAVCPEPNFRI
jgi:hypothetical protein